jgi:hypothetical protein
LKSSLHRSKKAEARAKFDNAVLVAEENFMESLVIKTTVEMNPLH